MKRTILYSLISLLALALQSSAWMPLHVMSGGGGGTSDTIALSQGPVTVTATGDDVEDTFSLTSWTPGANELAILFVNIYDAQTFSSISGNGLTWVQIANVVDTQNVNRIAIWRAMGASPSTGQITITLGEPLNLGDGLCAIAFSLSGVDTTGTNGSGAVEASNSAEVGVVDSNDPTVTVDTVSNFSWAVGLLGYRNLTYTLQGSETAIQLNLRGSSAGSARDCSAFYDATLTSPTTATLGGTDSLSGDREWYIYGLAIKPE